MTRLTPEVTAYFESLSPHATTELKLHERTVSTLKGLQLDNESSRRSTASSLKAIHAELARLAAAVTHVRVPASLALASATRVKAIQHAGAAVGELGDGLTGELTARRKSLERALDLAREAESVGRASTNSISAALGAAATAAAAIPIVGTIIGAIIAIIAAIIVLIGSILTQTKEQEAAEQGKHDFPETTKPKRRPWPP